MGRAWNKELRGVTAVFGLGIFSTAKALRPETCWCPERGAADRNSSFVFLRGKTPGEAVNVSGTLQILSQGGGTVLSRHLLPEYTQVHRRSLQHFNTPTVIYFGLLKPVAALSLTSSVGTHYNCLFNYFSWMPHLHFTKWTPETGAQLSPAEPRWRLFKERGGSQINTFLVLKVTSRGWQWEGSQGAISYLFVFWFDLSLDKVPELITVSVLCANRGPLQMFSRLEVPDVEAAAHSADRWWWWCGRPPDCCVRFGISRISSSDVCRNCKLCFLTSDGRFNENFCKVKCRGVKLCLREEEKFTLCMFLWGEVLQSLVSGSC